jgi:Fe-S-cluster containining protein
MPVFSHDSCKSCGAMCCRHLVIPILGPESKKDLEKLKWQLHFEAVKIFIQDKKWHMMLESKCRYLGKDERCDQYQLRPKICRRHNPPNCEFFGRVYDEIFKSPQELEEYCRAINR